jgi:superfamily II DNA or RNA helicase
MRLLFDRGTLVLDRVPAQLDLDEVPGLLWDPRTRECRAPGYRYDEVRAWLVRRGHDLDDQVRIRQERRRAPAVELRPYQESALTAWQLAGHRGVVALPTGSGKTRLALGAIAATGTAALVLVPTRVLMAQWASAIESALGIRAGCLGDGQRQVTSLTVATFESAYRHMARIGDRFELLVVDEVHHFGSGMREDALVMCTASMRLGLTATPPRESPATQRLTHLVGPPVYQLAIADLTGEYLAEYEVSTLTLPLTESERASYELDMARFRPLCRQFFRSNPLAAWTDFMRSARKTDEGRRALEAWRRSRKLLAYTEAKRQAVGSLLVRHRASKTLVFTATNEAAYAAARDHLVMPITCDIGRNERSDMLDRFRRGELRALVSARVLNEGLDVPEADVAIIVGGGSNERQHVQRVGRLLRPKAGKRAQVYELVAAETSEVFQSERRGRALHGHRRSAG